MAETANILQHASERSLVLLDEIGRGTSTYDGLSIAWATSEYLARQIRSRTIFATHYHEMNQLCAQYKNIKNMQVKVENKDGDLVFTHKVCEGGASRSYGVEVARLAGIPVTVIKNAMKKMKELTSDDLSDLPRT